MTVLNFPEINNEQSIDSIVFDLMVSRIKLFLNIILDSLITLQKYDLQHDKLDDSQRLTTLEMINSIFDLLLKIKKLTNIDKEEIT